MTKDRLAEFHKAGGVEKVKVRSGRAESTSSYADDADEKEGLIEQRHWDSYETYLARAGRVKSNIDVLVDDLKEVSKLHSLLLIGPSDPELNSKLNTLVEQFHMKARNVTLQVQEMNEELQRMVINKKNELEDANRRIRRDQVSMLSASLANVMQRFNTEQLDYKEKSKKKIANYLEVQGLELPEEIVDDIIENGDLTEHVKGLVLGVAEREALFADVRSRKNELLKIEKSIRELAEMFHDVHLLVLSQGEMMNNIERNVGSTFDYTEKARQDIVGAHKAQKRARYMKIGIVIGVILLIIFLFFLIKVMICFYAPFLCR